VITVLPCHAVHALPQLQVLQPALMAPPPSDACPRDQLTTLTPRAAAGLDWTFRWEVLPTPFDSIKDQPSDLYGEVFFNNTDYAAMIREVYGHDLSSAADVYWVTPLEEAPFNTKTITWLVSASGAAPITFDRSSV
jgi:hypothetical protein